MENPNSNEKCNKAWIEDNMLLTMFDSSSEINQEYALDQSNFMFLCLILHYVFSLFGLVGNWKIQT
jgi:hypothetical protein